MSNVRRFVQVDVAIVGLGPAGLQAALILARTRARLVAFDSPDPPRNAASHGVHNVLGLDGLRPAEIRETAWQQIARYGSVDYVGEEVVDIARSEDGQFVLRSDAGTQVSAFHVILATGYRDDFPAIPGFKECWGDSIIACPFCDGYENRDRPWAIVNAPEFGLLHLATMYRNWTPRATAIVSSENSVSEATRTTLAAHDLEIVVGTVTEIHHNSGKVYSVTLNTGETLEFETLLWRPDEIRLPLIQTVIDTFGLAVDETNHIQVDESFQTSVDRIWAVGDVRGWMGALTAAYQGSLAAYAITRERYAR